MFNHPPTHANRGWCQIFDVRIACVRCGGGANDCRAESRRHRWHWGVRTRAYTHTKKCSQVDGLSINAGRVCVCVCWAIERFGIVMGVLNYLNYCVKSPVTKRRYACVCVYVYINNISSHRYGFRQFQFEAGRTQILFGRPSTPSKTTRTPPNNSTLSRPSLIVAACSEFRIRFERGGFGVGLCRCFYAVTQFYYELLHEQP